MEIAIDTTSNEYVIIRLNGKLTIESVFILEEAAYPLLKEEFKKIFINFSQMSYLDSSGIGALIKYMNTVKNSNKN